MLDIQQPRLVGNVTILTLNLGHIPFLGENIYICIIFLRHWLCSTSFYYPLGASEYLLFVSVSGFRVLANSMMI
jgi:hypothetical protein